MATINNFEDLEIWQNAKNFVKKLINIVYIIQSFLITIKTKLIEHQENNG